MRKLGCAARKRGFACTVNYFKINASFGWRRLQLAVRRVAAAVCREQALLHYPAHRAASDKSGII